MNYAPTGQQPKFRYHIGNAVYEYDIYKVLEL